MVASYNGFKASPNPADFGGLDNRFVPGTGAKLSPGVRAGDVATVLFYVASQWDKRVEDLDLYAGGDEWGYYYKPSANSPKLLSCHSSGTAADLNSTRHPNGRRGTYSAQQVAEIRAILAEVDDTVYWGGDAWGNGTPDEMHVEIATGVTLEQLAAVATKINSNAVKVKPKPAPATQWYRGLIGTRVMQNGSQGEDVTKLQAFMIHAYALYAKHLQADGIYGDQTEAVVREFQKRTGLAVDGVAGPKTLRAMKLI